ncbi:MAG: hypothetical protein RLY31_1922 [Bacteroidota bacterium]|jgi:alkaline phosphatase D
MRTFLLLLLLATAVVAARTQGTYYHPELGSLVDTSRLPFCFGIASGDPLPSAVVIWTKLYLPEDTTAQPVFWELAHDEGMERTVASGWFTALPATAYTVKVDVGGLAAGTTYHYRFRWGNRWSMVGDTRTAAAGSPDTVRFAVVSCADYVRGYYNAFADIARRRDLDAVLHLGDYIYEYGNWKGFRGKGVVRRHIPDHTCRTLQDYRTRYAQYRCDPQLAAAHRRHPFIVVWDDHEIANNSHTDGTDGHLGDAAWEERKAHAIQAYFEWMPIREQPAGQRVMRRFHFGELADLWMLDGRMEGRSPQAAGKDDPRWQDPDRTMLGADQRRWLLEGMDSSTARWKVWGNQVIFSPLNDSKVFDRRPAIAMDRWDGYPAERRLLFDHLETAGDPHLIVLTGDVHTSWVFDLTANPLDPGRYDPATGKGVLGAEFVTPSVSSFNFDEVLPRPLVLEARRRFTKASNNPHLRYVDLVRHGYLTLTLSRETARADYFYVPIKERTDKPANHRAAFFMSHDQPWVRKTRPSPEDRR